MMELFRRVGQWIGRMTGYSNLDKPFMRYFIVYACYTLAQSLAGAYFNVYLLRATGSSMALMIYNLVLALVQPLVMLLAVKMLRRTNTTRCMQIGLMLHSVGYLTLAIAGETTEPLVFAVSAIFSSANAFYFSSYTPQMLSYLNDRNRDTAFGAMGLYSTAIGLVLPILTGFFITSFGDLTGYRILFALASVIIVAAAGLSFRMTPIPKASGNSKGHLRTAAKHFFGSRSIMEIMAVTALDSLRLSGASYFASLLVYELLQREAVMGVLSTFTSILSMLANVAYGRYVTKKNRGSLMLVGSLVSFLAVIIVCVWRTAPGYVIYSVLGSLVGVFLGNPVVTGYMSVVEQDPVLAENAAEVHALREIFYASGRALGLLPVFFLKDPAQMAAIMMVAMTALQIPASLLTIHVQKKRQTRN